MIEPNALYEMSVGRCPEPYQRNQDELRVEQRQQNWLRLEQEEQEYLRVNQEIPTRQQP